LPEINLETDFKIISKEDHSEGGPEKLDYSFIVAERK